MSQTHQPKGVTRIEIPDKQTFGWMMRIRRKAKRLHEWFPDKKFGGNRKAKRAAIQRYEKLSGKLPKPNVSSKDRMTMRNTSGKVGVYIKVSAGRKKSKGEYFAYTAFWLGKKDFKESVSFSWNKYGDDTAWAMACYARKNETKNKRAIEKRFGFGDARTK